MKFNDVEKTILKELGFNSENGTNEVVKKEYQNTTDRRKIRDNMVKILLIISKCKNEKQFNVFYSKFVEDYKKYYISQNPLDFSVFSNLRSENKISIVENAEKVISKFVKK